MLAKEESMDHTEDVLSADDSSNVLPQEAPWPTSRNRCSFSVSTFAFYFTLLFLFNISLIAISFPRFARSLNLKEIPTSCMKLLDKRSQKYSD